MDRVQVAVVGTSWWADLVYLPILSGYERADLVAICGRTTAPAQAMAAKYSIPRIYHDYRQMIAEAELDALVISTPDDSHHEICMAALEAGLHVLCEKPLALNAGDAREMAEKARSTGVTTQVLFTLRWLPQFQLLKRQVDAGYIGRPYHADIRFTSGYGRNDNYMWRVDGERGNGILGDLGSHMIDMARWYLGEISSVSGLLGTYGQHQGPHGEASMAHPANDSGALLLEFANGAQASIAFSAVALQGHDDTHIDVTLHGEKGSLYSRQAHGHPEYKVWGVQQPDADFAEIPMPPELLRHVDAKDWMAHFQYQPVGPRLWIDSILAGQPVEPDLYDGYKVQQVIDAALESHRSGRRIDIA